MLNNLRWLITILVLLIPGAPALAQASSPAAPLPPVTLVEAGRSRCVIVYPDGCALSARTAGKLANYLKAQTDVNVSFTAAGQFKEAGADVAVIVLDGTDDHRLVAKWGAQTDFSSRRPDGYELKVLRRDNGPPLVLAIGEAPQGAKYAAYRLMRELRIDGRNASVPVLNVRAEPFIETRSVALFNVWGMPIELTRRHNTEPWPLEALERYLDMYDFFGFNAIESHDRFNDTYLEPLFGLKRAQWRDKVQRLSDFAHQNGQEFFLRIWGHTVMETPRTDKPLGPNQAVPKKLKELCPNDPAERQRWDEDILNYYVTHYSGRIDHLIGHWCDPGVCRRNGCTFRTPMQLHMELHNAFKARDPDFESTFSMWFFDVTAVSDAGWAHGGWSGYENDRDLINAGILDKAVNIATYTFRPDSYKEEIVQAILAAGHNPAVWTWYRADHETRPTLHIHLRERLGDYFRNLPSSAGQLDWHNIERNVHAAANTANYYVAGRLMWEPSLNVDELLNEFLTLIFGPDNAAKILPAYRAIESIRCHSCYLNWERKFVTGAGTDDARADGAAARSALARLAEVKLDPDYRPRLPLDLSPARIVADLTASLEVIRDFADCRANELPAIEKAIEAGDHAAATERLDGLHVKYQPWSLTLAGRQEWAVLSDRITSFRKRMNAASPE